MTITKLNLHYFRNIESASISFSPNFNFIVGQNGSGKTSLLEAIYMLGHGRAFRHLLTRRIITHEQDKLTLFALIESASKPFNVGLSKAKNGQNVIKINNDTNHTLASLASLLPLQLITPEDFDLITGSPKYRRAYIDWGCFHHFPEFISLWNKLKRIIKQRNALLKNVTNYDNLYHWDKGLIPVSHKITALRQTYINDILPMLANTCQNFLPEYQLDYDFFCGWNADIPYDEALKQQFLRDKQLNYTTLGAHKADLKISHKKIPVQDSFSRGQLKLLMCALRITQGEFYFAQKNQRCIYLIDDFTSELDLSKQQLLIDKLKQMNAQVFITALSDAQIKAMISQNDKIFHIKSGIITS